MRYCFFTQDTVIISTNKPPKPNTFIHQKQTYNQSTMDNLPICVICGRENSSRVPGPNDPVEPRPNPVVGPLPFESWVERNPHPGFDLDDIDPDELAIIVLDNDVFRYSGYLMETHAFREEGHYFEILASEWLKTPHASRLNSASCSADRNRQRMNRISSEGFETRNPPPQASMLDAENNIRDLRRELEYMTIQAHDAKARYENAEKLIAVMIRSREAGKG